MVKIQHSIWNVDRIMAQLRGLMSAGFFVVIRTGVQCVLIAEVHKNLMSLSVRVYFSCYCHGA